MIDGIQGCRLAASELNFNRRRFALTLDPEDTDKPEFKISFEGFVAHYLEPHPYQTYLERIEQTEPSSLIRENWEHILRCWQAGEWRGPCPTSEESAMAHIASASLRGYRIYACGQQIGWAISQSLVKLGRSGA